MIALSLADIINSLIPTLCNKYAGETDLECIANYSSGVRTAAKILHVSYLLSLNLSLLCSWYQLWRTTRLYRKRVLDMRLGEYFCKTRKPGSGNKKSGFFPATSWVGSQVCITSSCVLLRCIAAMLEFEAVAVCLEVSIRIFLTEIVYFLLLNLSRVSPLS